MQRKRTVVLFATLLFVGCGDDTRGTDSGRGNTDGGLEDAVTDTGSTSEDAGFGLDAAADAFVTATNCLPRCMAKAALCGDEAPLLEALCVGTCSLRPSEARILCIEGASCAALAEGACAPGGSDAGTPDAGPADAGTPDAGGDAGPVCFEPYCESISARRTCTERAPGTPPLIREEHCGGFLCQGGECTDIPPPTEATMYVTLNRAEPMPFAGRDGQEIWLRGNYVLELPALLHFPSADNIRLIAPVRDPECTLIGVRSEEQIVVTDTEFSIVFRGGSQCIPMFSDLGQNGATVTMEVSYGAAFEDDVSLTVEIRP